MYVIASYRAGMSAFEIFEHSARKWSWKKHLESIESQTLHFAKEILEQ